MIDVRHEQPGDEAEIRAVNDQAFGQADESRIIAAIRRARHSAISLVATDGSKIVGSILFTPISIEPHVPSLHVMGLGPMAVLPDWQRRGIGSKLVEAGLRECKRVGCDVVVVIGHPEFYPRFGFRPASTFQLRSEFDVRDEVFMVAELTTGALAGRGGLVRYVPEFGSA